MAKHVEAIRSSFLTLFFGGTGWEPLPVLTCPSTTHQNKGVWWVDPSGYFFYFYYNLSLFFIFSLAGQPANPLSIYTVLGFPTFQNFLFVSATASRGWVGINPLLKFNPHNPCFKQVDGMVWRVDVFATSTCAM